MSHLIQLGRLLRLACGAAILLIPAQLLGQDRPKFADEFSAWQRAKCRLPQYTPAIASTGGTDASVVADLGDGQRCRATFGTKVEFVNSPSEAFKLATKDRKLVFILDVSGDFDDPGFT